MQSLTRERVRSITNKLNRTYLFLETNNTEDKSLKWVLRDLHNVLSLWSTLADNLICLADVVMGCILCKGWTI